MTEDNCIYCRKVVDVDRGEGDHVIPAALGQFDGEFVFRRICRDCNSLIGKCEEQLLRCAPEAVMRRMVQPVVKRNRRGTSWVGANGMPPPKFLIDRGDHHELGEGSSDDPRNVLAIDQLVIVNEEKAEHHLRLFPGMTVARIRTMIDALGASTFDQMFLHADETTYPKYFALLNELQPGSTVVEKEATEAGIHQVKGQTTFTFHTDYWRAIAKIGFHYYLLNSRCGVRGDEPEFADIRNFITVSGGDPVPFFQEPAAQFVLPFGKHPDGSIILPESYVHVIAADETSKASVAMVSLFMGPKRLAPTFHINLGRPQSGLVVQDAWWAHSYLYDINPRRDDRAGRVVANTLSKLR